ncbi:NAD(P)H-dependent oxidoreductase [Pedobacter petrophilus]|uniref:NAD(P)H-dependent oxidoreductase n=2 Tax=Pedobacter TaxID=84567 RepID=A0A7K0G5W8_9SPHI|nr:NAD(P)H-dependent oxidoreductase [Pedobacter petrophilus]MRX78860.1 NAD(P)H-dependent oxidoreductase [Pedobacter petrophilus]
MKLLENLKWRYATKKFNDQKVSSEEIDKLIEAINLSASSTGIQPYRIVIIQNQALRKELGEGSFNSQIIDCSHLIVFAAYEKVTLEHIEGYMNRIANRREIPVESLGDFKLALVNGLLSMSDDQSHIWAAKQAYIGLGTALIAAAELKIDATPMEGFDAGRFDDLLGLNKSGLKSVVTLAIGYRDEKTDPYANLKKVRLSVQDFASSIG